MLSCKEATQLLSDSLDRRLPLRQRIALRMHLLMCRVCPRIRRQMLFLREAASRYLELEEGGAPLLLVSLAGDTRERIKRALAAASETADK